MKNKELHNNIKSGFKVPDNYFSNLEEQIISEIHLKSKISESGFKVPDNYFDNLNEKIIKQTKPETKVIPLFSKQNLIYIASIAATIILIITLTFNNNKAFTFENLEQETVDNYILEEVSSSDLSSLFEDSELTEIDFIDYDITDETFQYYIDNSNVEDLILE